MSRYVIVGGVAGGATAATRLRRRDKEAEIIVKAKNIQSLPELIAAA